MCDFEQEAKRKAEIIKSLNARIELLQTPICIGRPLIAILADKGAWVANGGAGAAVVAADELFKANPYDEIDRLKADLKISREACQMFEQAANDWQSRALKAEGNNNA